MRLNWFIKFLARFSPKSLFKLAARDNKLDYAKVESAEKLFRDAKRIDFQPSGGANGRSLIMYIDKKLSLHFYQDGNTFTYDGFEMGPYDDGDVTVFDKMK
jgi:hypothetical protein